MGAIKLENVSKSFGNVNVIPGVDLEINDGEFVVFVGPSGCGKSTLLRLIAGLEDISGGKISIDGVDATNLPPAKRKLAMVFQSYALYPHMTVYKNIAFSAEDGRSGRGGDRQEGARRRQCAEPERLSRSSPGELSGGQRQRVAIGRAIVREPSAFMFDEPLSNLDAALRGSMRLEISELHNELSTTMVYVTHDQIEAMTMADKIVVLHDGYIEQVGSPMELYRNPANTFVAGFIGSPKMNLIGGEAASRANATHHRRPSGALQPFQGERRLVRRDQCRRTPWLGHAAACQCRRRGRGHRARDGRVRRPPWRQGVPEPGSGSRLSFRRGRQSDLMVALDGKSALITGAARGIGKTIAAAYAREGALVAVADIDLNRANAAAEEIGLGAYAVRMDVGDQASIGQAFAMVEERAGGLDILVNNAALFDAAPISEITRDSYDSLFAVNVAGTLFTMQAAANVMIAQGRGGRIINMASQAGRRGESLVAVYCATKAAVISLTQSAGLNLIPHGINVNAIAPGVVEGEHWDGVDALFAKYEGLAPGEKRRIVGEAVPLWAHGNRG